jgi:hypothetical protein
MKIDVNTILWIVLIILAILYLRSCNKEESVEIQTVTVSDTTYVKGKTDTFLLLDTVIKYKYLTSTVIETIHDTISGDTIHKYSTPVEDSLLTATITSTVKGELLNTSFNYKPKFPKYITRVDTLRIEDSTTVTITKNPWSLYFGGVAGGNANTFEVVPTVLLKTPKSLQLSFGYGIINKTYNVGMYAKIPNPFKK